MAQLSGDIVRKLEMAQCLSFPGRDIDIFVCIAFQRSVFPLHPLGRIVQGPRTRMSMTRIYICTHAIGRARRSVLFQETGQLDLSDVMLWAQRSLTTTHQSTVSILITSPMGHGMQYKLGNRFSFTSTEDPSRMIWSLSRTVSKAVDACSSVIRPSINTTR